MSTKVQPMSRSRRHPNGRAGKAFASVLATMAMLLSAIAFTGASPAVAAAGTPGFASDPTVIFHEDFEHGLASDELALLTDYTGALGTTYGGTPFWTEPTMCNGIVISRNTPAPSFCGGNGDDRIRQMAQVLGIVNGSTTATANHSVSAYTNSPTTDFPLGANDIEFETKTPVAVPAGSRFLTFSFNAASANCGVAAATMSFFLKDGATEIPATAAPINVCTNPAAGPFNVSGLPFIGGSFTSDSSVLFSGTALDIVMRNGTSTSAGNDHAYDDIKVLDATPQLDKNFGTRGNEWVAGEQVPLTFTITNTSELAEKDGWSLTDTLPAGLSVDTAGGTTTCAAATVTAAAGSDTIEVTAGKIAAGVTSCTVTVQVRSNKAQEFTNGPDNVTTVGLNPPGDTTVTYNDPTPPKACTAAQTRPTERFWFFGKQGKIDFGTSGATATPSVGTHDTMEGSTVITDTAGNLQFWSNGETIFDANDDPMPNGDDLSGEPSAAQTVAAFPAPGNAGVYYVVTTSADVGVAPNGSLSYSVVDMSLNGGLGDVTAVKNVPLGAPDTASEALTAVPSDDGNAFWVLTYTNGTPNNLAYKFDGTGPVGSVVTSVMPTNSYDGYGSLAFSADLKQLVQLTSRFTGGSPRPAIVRLLNFDADTGVMGEKFSWPQSNAGGTMGYTADFSPSGKYVYATRAFSGARLFRYQVEGATSSADIKASEENLGTIGTFGGQVRRGPDGKMYVANHGGTALSVVNTPDAASPGLIAGGFPLPAGSESRFGLPQMVTGCPVPPDPKLEIVKSSTFATDANSNGKADLGDVLTYGFIVTNTGNVAVTGVTVDDPMLTAAGVVVSPALPVGLVPDESRSYTATYTVRQVDVDAGGVFNVATAKGTSGVEEVVSPPDENEVEGPGSDPGLSIVKTADLDDANDNGFADKGEEITYSFEASNSGNVNLTDVSVTDPKVDGLSPASADIAVNDSATFTADPYTVTQADVDAGEVVNSATATGTPPTGPKVTSPPHEVTVPTPPRVPSLTIDKESSFTDDANDNGLADLDDEVEYTFTVKNTGNVTLTGVKPVDAKVSGITPASATLSPGETQVFTASYVVTQGDVNAGGVFNTATATGQPPVGPKVTSPPDENRIDGPDPEPNVTIVKTADITTDNGTPDKGDVGDVITYTFTVHNAGPGTAYDVEVNDPLDGLSAIGPGSVAELAPGADAEFTATYVVKQSDIDAGNGVSNQATATLTPPTPIDEEPPPPRLTPPSLIVVVPTVDPDPELTIVKSGDLEDENDNGKADKGEQINYSFTVENTGNTTMTGVEVSDPRVSGLSPASVTLAPGEDQVFTADPYTVTQADVDAGEVVNFATTRGTSPGGPEFVSPPTEHVVDGPDPEPGLDIEKFADLDDENDNGKADKGEKINYSFVVLNTGNVTLHAVTVNDARIEGLTPGSIGFLAPGESQGFEADPYVVTAADVKAGKVVNIATAEGTPPQGAKTTSDPDTVTTPTTPPRGGDGGGDSGGDLPDTGAGSGMESLMIGGFILLMAGAGLVMGNRRKKTPGGQRIASS